MRKFRLSRQGSLGSCTARKCETHSRNGSAVGRLFSCREAATLCAKYRCRQGGRYWLWALSHRGVHWVTNDVCGRPTSGEAVLAAMLACRATFKHAAFEKRASSHPKES